MITRKYFLFWASLLFGAVAIAIPQRSFAAYTPACTPINNLAGVSFSVGGVPQTGISSNTATFNVGNRVSVSVTSQDASFVSVVPGDTAKALNFLITNNGNANQKYVLTLPASAQVSGQTAKGVTDNFDATTPGIGAIGVTTITTAAMLPGDTLTVTIVTNIAPSQLDSDAAIYALMAQTYKVDGTTVETAGTGSVTSIAGTCIGDIVLADTTAGSDDLARDGKDSARGAYKVTATQLSFNKLVTTIWDPINGNNSPKAIPGSLIQYSLTILNAAGSSSAATLTLVTDALSGNLAIDQDLKVPVVCAIPPCTLASLANGSGVAGKGFKVITGGTSTRGSKTIPLYFTTAIDSDGVDISGQAITATMATTLPAEGTYTAGQLKPGESVTLTFNVTVN